MVMFCLKQLNCLLKGGDVMACYNQQGAGVAIYNVDR